MRAPQADRSDFTVSDRVGQTITAAFDDTVGTQARLFIPIIDDASLDLHIPGATKLNAVFGAIRGVLGGVELHLFM